VSATVTVRKDSEGRVDQITISEGRKKPLIVNYVYVQDGLTLVLRGDKSLLPSYSELLRMVDAKFAERISVIASQPQVDDAPFIVEEESGAFLPHIFSTTAFETIKEFQMTRSDRSLRTYVRARLRFSNPTGVDRQVTARIFQDNVNMEVKALTIVAGGTGIIELFTRQPPLFNVRGTIRIEALTPALGLFVMADAANSNWAIERRLATEELLRSEYSPNMCGVAIWNTPTMIPRFEKEDFDKAWNWSDAGGAVLMPYVEFIGTGTYYGQNNLVIPNKIMVTLMSNIFYGSIHWLPMRWGQAPGAGRDRSIGFDRPTFADCACFWISGTHFYAITRSFGQEELTEVAWHADMCTDYHRYEILWFPNRVEFYIDEAIVAIHTVVMEAPSGLQFFNNDTLAGNMEIASHFEVENCAGNAPIVGKNVKLLISTASIAASGSSSYNLNLKRLKTFALTVKCTYDVAATKGIRVYVQANIDTTFAAGTFDSDGADAFTYFEPTFTVNTTKQRTVNIDCIPQFVRITVTNLDTVKAVTGVTVHMHVAGD